MHPYCTCIMPTVSSRMKHSNQWSHQLRYELSPIRMNHSSAGFDALSDLACPNYDKVRTRGFVVDMPAQRALIWDPLNLQWPTWIYFHTHHFMQSRCFATSMGPVIPRGVFRFSEDYTDGKYTSIDISSPCAGHLLSVWHASMHLWPSQLRKAEQQDWSYPVGSSWILYTCYRVGPRQADAWYIRWNRVMLCIYQSV